MILDYENKIWFSLYKGALLELDRQKLSERIASAKEAISERLQQLEGSEDHHEERTSLADAVSGLGILEAEVSGSSSNPGQSRS